MARTKVVHERDQCSPAPPDPSDPFPPHITAPCLRAAVISVGSVPAPGFVLHKSLCIYELFLFGVGAETET